MNSKPEIIGALGELSLLLPEAIGRALVANDRIQSCFSLFELAERHARRPEAEVPSVAYRESFGLGDPSFDGVIDSSRLENGLLHMPRAPLIHRTIVESIDEMIAPLAMATPSAASAAIYRDRLQAVLAALPRMEGDSVPESYLLHLTQTQQGSADTLALLVADLNRSLGELQSSLSRENVAGASAYGLDDSDRVLLQAFMKGVNRTAALKCEHPGLGTTATRTDGVLVIQNDIGQTDAHVLLVRVGGLECSLTLADPHLQRVRFLQSLLTAFRVAWSDTRSREAKWLEEGETYYQSVGRFTARDRTELEQFLELVGSRIVFLIEWNRARKKLRNFVDGASCVEVLRMAADSEVGHAAFLQLGGERLVYDAIERASPTPLRYGQRLDEILGRGATVEFLSFVLRVTSQGLLHGRSERFVRDEIQADLLGRFETLEHGVLTIATRHAAIISELTAAVLEGIQDGSSGSADLRSRAADCEKRADALVDRVRNLARHSPHGQLYERLLTEADNVADSLEECAFLLSLPPGRELARPAREPLQALVALLIAGGQQWANCLESAERLTRHAAHDDLQQFLETVDRILTLEQQTDDSQREVTAALFGDGVDFRQLHLLTLVAHSLEQASDALARCALLLRGHFLSQAMS